MECVPVVNESDLNGQAEILEVIFAFSHSMALKNAIDLGIADVIASKGPGAWLTLEEIATAVSAKNTDFLFRLMRFLVRGKIFSQQDNKYGLTRSSKWLVRKGSKHSLAPLASFVLDKFMQEPWHHLQECIQQGGEDAFAKAHKGVSLFDSARLNPWFNDLFNNAMVSDTTISISSVLQHYHGFEGIGTLVDVGGGVGLALSMITAAYPYVKGINFDLPHVIAKTQAYTGVEHVAGDMFEGIPPGDAILMKWILHDWNDSDCVRILSNCYAALPANGKVVILDAVLPGNADETGRFDNVRAGFDLQMAATTPGGKERDEVEWRDVLARAGFPNVKVHSIPILQSVIEAFKA